MHLNDADMLSLVEGHGDSAMRDHVAACAACRQALRQWQEHLPDLHALAALELDEAERHRLRVLYRTRGPAKVGLGSWVAELVRSLTPAQAGVRGATSQMLELAAGPYRVVLQQQPGPLEGVLSVHGQLLHEDDELELGGEMVLLAENGLALVAPIDELGEFHLSEVPEGRYSATWWVSEGRIRAPELEVGERAEL